MAVKKKKQLWQLSGQLTILPYSDEVEQVTSAAGWHQLKVIAQKISQEGFIRQDLITLILIKNDTVRSSVRYI